MVRFKLLPGGDDLVTLIEPDHALEVVAQTDTSKASSEESDVRTNKLNLSRTKGLALVAVSGFLYCTALAIATRLTKVGSGEVVLVQSFISLSFTVPLLFHRSISPLHLPDKHWVLVRSVFGAASYILTVWCVHHMRFGDAIVLVYLDPIFAGIFAKLVLGERYGLVNLTGSFACIIGALLVTQPGAVFGVNDTVSSISVIGSCMALLAAVLQGVSYLAIRIAQQTHPLTLTFYLNLFTLPLAAIYQISISKTLHNPTCYNDRGMLTIVGLLMFLSQTLLHKGLRTGAAAPTSLMRNLDIVIAYMYQVMLLKEDMDVLSLIGVVMIILSTSVIFIHALLKEERSYDEDEGDEDEEEEDPEEIYE